MVAWITGPLFLYLHKIVSTESVAPDKVWWFECFQVINDNGDSFADAAALNSYIYSIKFHHSR